MKNIWKKLLIIFSICLASFTYLTPVMAAQKPNTPTLITIIADNSTITPNLPQEHCSENFLGLTSWYCGIEGEMSIQEFIIKIIMNVLTDATVIAAYLILGFVIYGGYNYMFSYGDAGKVEKGKKTLTNAFIGLAIVLLSSVIFSSIRIALIGNNPLSPLDATADVNSMITNLIQWVVGIAGVVAAIFVVYGGISYVTSTGDPNKLSKAKSVIINALIGLAIVALAEVITAFVSNIIRDAGNNTSNITNSLIAKE